jgi:hypothetical protein
MRFYLGSLVVQLETNDKVIVDGLNAFLKSWPEQEVQLSSNELSGEANQPIIRAEVQYHLAAVDRLSGLPDVEPIFIEKLGNLPDEKATVAIYQTNGEYLLHFRGGAIVHIPLSSRIGETRFAVKAEVLNSRLDAGHLEDIIFAGLAPILRRHGYYLTHAFAACWMEKAILFVGPSGSGKTTAGLGLVSSGWGYLANDVVLIQKVNDSVWALPTPGGIAIAPETTRLISSLFQSRSRNYFPDTVKKSYLPAADVVPGWAYAAPVKAICFPSIQKGGSSSLSLISQAEALATLMESSVDRWDDDTLIRHIDLLQRLCLQVDSFKLHLGEDVSQLSELLSDVW